MPWNELTARVIFGVIARHIQSDGIKQKDTFTLHWTRWKREMEEKKQS